MDTQTDETKPDRQPNTGKSGYSYNNKIFVDYQDKKASKEVSWIFRRLHLHVTECTFNLQLKTYNS